MSPPPTRRLLPWIALAAIAAGIVAVVAFRRSVDDRLDDARGQGDAPAPGPDPLAGVRVGTERPLEPIAPGVGEHPFLGDVRALLPLPDEVWVGTTGGLRVVDPDDPDRERIYTARSGLLRNDVIALARDGATVIVAHPEEGLSRIRDARVRTLAHPELVPTALVATGEEVYVGTADRGLLRLDDDTLIEVPIAGERADGAWSIERPRITALAWDAEADALIVGLFDGGVAERGREGWRLHTTADGLADPFVTSLSVAPTADGRRLLVGTQTGLTVLHGDRTAVLGRAEGLPDDHVAAVAQRDDRLAAGTFGGGAGLLTGDGWGTVTAPDLPSGHVGALAFDARGRLWIGTRDGLAVGDDTGWQRRPAPVGPPGARITAITSEPGPAGAPAAVWVGTFERGVGRWMDGQWTSYGVDDGLPSPEINALVVHRNVLWVATNAGPAWWDDGRFERHPRLDALRGEAVTALLSDGDALWLGTAAGALRLGSDGGVRRIGVRDGLVNGHVYALARGPEHIWAGTLAGLCGLRPDGAPRPSTTPTVEAGPGGLSHGWVNGVLARGDTLFVGSYGGGVDRRDGGAWGRVDPAAPGALEINPGAACWLGERALFGTLDRGLVVLDSDGGAGQLRDDELGLPSPSVTALHFDGGALWVGTAAGLARLEPGVVVR